MVEWVVGGLKVPLTYRWTREVLPTPNPRTQSRIVKRKLLPTLCTKNTDLGFKIVCHCGRLIGIVENCVVKSHDD